MSCLLPAKDILLQGSGSIPPLSSEAQHCQFQPDSLVPPGHMGTPLETKDTNQNLQYKSQQPKTRFGLFKVSWIWTEGKDQILCYLMWLT